MLTRDFDGQRSLVHRPSIQGGLLGGCQETESSRCCMVFTAEACEKEKNRAGNLTTDAMQRQCHEISTRVLGGGSYYTHMYRLLQAACRSPSTGKWGTYRGVGQDHSHLRETHEQKTHAFSQKR